MAINFPSNPIDGNQYTFNNIVFTYKKPSGADGYWAVLTPSTAGVATAAEIDEGTNNEKYASPAGLEGSKYVREDETSGETVLNYNNVERVKADAQGVVVTGRMILDGKLVKVDRKYEDVFTEFPKDVLHANNKNYPTLFTVTITSNTVVDGYASAIIEVDGVIVSRNVGTSRGAHVAVTVSAEIPAGSSFKYTVVSGSGIAATMLR